jgi:hypothetical protein
MFEISLASERCRLGGGGGSSGVEVDSNHLRSSAGADFRRRSTKSKGDADAVPDSRLWSMLRLGVPDVSAGGGDRFDLRRFHC